MANIFNEVMDNQNQIILLNYEEFKLWLKYRNKLSNKISEQYSNIEQEFENIKNNSSVNNSNLDIIEIQTSQFKLGTAAMNDINDKNKYEVELYMHLLKMYIIKSITIQLNFSIANNDYGKSNAKLKNIKEAIQTSLGLFSKTSNVVAVANLISIIENSANIENYDDLKNKFYGTTDDNLYLVEEQFLLLKQVADNQKIIIYDLKKDIERTRKKLENDNRLNNSFVK